jgi:hypothetical protein
MPIPLHGLSAMNRRILFNVLRVVVSVGLVIFVCSRITVSDRLIKSDGSVLTGSLVKPVGPKTFVIDTADGRLRLDVSELRRDAKGNLTGVQRGIVTVLGSVDLSWFIPMFLLFGVIPVVASIRWYWLLRVQGVVIPVTRAVSLAFLGYFFNNFMLGLTGGDIVKAFYVARETHKKTEAVVTVFLDRIVGLIALAALAAAMVLVNISDEKFRQAALLISVFLVMSLFCVLVLFSRTLRRQVQHTLVAVAAAGGALILTWRWFTHGWEHIRNEVIIFAAVIAVLVVITRVAAVWRFLRLDQLRARFTGNRRVREMDQAFHVFSRHPAVSAAAFAVSFVCHFTTIVGVYGFARSLGIAAPFHAFLVFVPVIVMISAIPVSVSGWGVQEAVYQVFFGTVGVGATEAITLSFVYRLCAAVIWSLPGGLILMLLKDRASVKEAEAALAEEGPA